MRRETADKLRAALMAGFAVLIAWIDFAAAVLFFLSIFTATVVSAFSTAYGVAVLAAAILAAAVLDPWAALAFFTFLALSLAMVEGREG